jgi:hypothetical protein
MSDLHGRLMAEWQNDRRWHQADWIGRLDWQTGDVNFRAANGTFSGPLYQFTLAILLAAQMGYLPELLPICHSTLANSPNCQFTFTKLPFYHNTRPNFQFITAIMP